MRITANSHGFATGDLIYINGVDTQRRRIHICQQHLGHDLDRHQAWTPTTSR